MEISIETLETLASILIIYVVVTIAAAMLIGMVASSAEEEFRELDRAWTELKEAFSRLPVVLKLKGWIR